MLNSLSCVCLRRHEESGSLHPMDSRRHKRSCNAAAAALPAPGCSWHRCGATGPAAHSAGGDILEEGVYVVEINLLNGLRRQHTHVGPVCCCVKRVKVILIVNKNSI